MHDFGKSILKSSNCRSKKMFFFYSSGISKVFWTKVSSQVRPKGEDKKNLFLKRDYKKIGHIDASRYYKNN